MSSLTRMHGLPSDKERSLLPQRLIHIFRIQQNQIQINKLPEVQRMLLESFPSTLAKNPRWLTQTLQEAKEQVGDLKASFECVILQRKFQIMCH